MLVIRLSVCTFFFSCLVACAAKQTSVPPSPIYSMESFESLDKFLKEYQANFFHELKEAEAEEVFHGVHPELTKAKSKILHIYETRPAQPGDENWKKAVALQLESGEELVRLSEALGKDASLSKNLQKRLSRFHLEMSSQWEQLLDQYGLFLKEKSTLE